MRKLVLQDRATEDRALAEVVSLDMCLYLAARESDPGVGRTRCESTIQSALERRLPSSYAAYTVLKSEQRNEYGGAWSFRTLHLGQPGHCDDSPCDDMLAVEVTNTTAAVLRCEIALSVSNSQDGTRRGEQAITLYPGDSLPAARVSIRRAPERVEPEVTCSRATPLVPELPVPAACVLHWRPSAFEYPRYLSRSAWESGAALVEFATQKGHKAPEAINVVQADSSRIGGAARELIEKMRFATNCAGQHFRLRVEYRALPCYVCLVEYGVVTLLRDDRRN